MGNIKRAMIVVGVCCLFFGCNNSKEEARKYVKELNNYSFHDVYFRKVLIDPSFNYPYNLYIRFSMDSATRIKLINDLRLLESFGYDSSIVKRKMPLDEYDLFFKVSSINKGRNSFVRDIENKIDWWPFKDGYLNPAYASPYKDSLGTKGVVSLNDHYNGRLALTIDKSNVYILIECWDW